MSRLEPAASPSPHSSPPARRELLAVPVFFAVLAALLAWATWGTRGVDDVQITFVYARSFAEGNGLAWNGGAGLGTSSPALAVLLGAVSRWTTVDVAVLGIGFGWLSLWISAVALHRLGREEGWTWAGVLAGTLWILDGYPLHLGGEYLPAVAAALLAALAFRGGRPWLAGGLLGVAAALRMEVGAIAPLLAFAHGARVGIRQGVADSSRAAAAALALILGWIGVLWGIAGEVVPLTLAAKQAQAVSQLGVWRPGPRIARLLREPWSLLPTLDPWLFAVLAAAGIAFLALRRRGASFAIALVAWAGVHLGVLVALALPIYPWYTTPWVLALVLLVALAAGLPERLEGRARWVARFAVGVAVSLLVARDVGRSRLKISLAEDQRRPSYEEAAALAASYPSWVSIAAWEVGILAYQSRRPVLDLLGLVTPGADLAAVRSGELWRNVDRLDPDLLLTPLRHGSLVARSIGDPARFLRGYELDHLRPGQRHPFAIYRKRSVPGRGNVAWYGLDSRHPARRVSLDGQEWLALPVRARQRIERPLPPRLRGRLWLGIGALHGAAQVRVSIVHPNRQPATIEVQAPQDSLEWHSIDLGAPRRGRRLALSCSAPPPAECLAVQPHVPRTEFGAPFRAAVDAEGAPAGTGSGADRARRRAPARPDRGARPTAPG